MIEKPQMQSRFHKDAWLQTAMDVLAKEGQAKIRIEQLAAALGVTKGSFYHHFKNREDFLINIVKYWKETLTDFVVDQMRSSPIPAKEKLLQLMITVRGSDLDKYEIAFRSWAAQDKLVSDLVREVDYKRYIFIRELFSEMGFAGAELDMRVQVFLVWVSGQRTVYVPEAHVDMMDGLKMRHQFFTSKINLEHTP